MGKFKSKKFLAAVIVLLLLGAAALVLNNRRQQAADSSQPERETVTAFVGDLAAEATASGNIQAGLAGNAGVGRAGSPSAGTWKQVKADYPELFPNAHELEIEWYNRTGIYPIHGTIVVKDKVLEEHPWVARSLYDAFMEAKREWLPKLHSGIADSAKDKKYREQAKIVGKWNLTTNSAT